MKFRLTAQRALLAFARQYAIDGQISREQWEKTFTEPSPSDEYIKGYNAGVEGVLLAVELFTEDNA